jgi:hypothetical protein
MKCKLPVSGLWRVGGGGVGDVGCRVGGDGQCPFAVRHCGILTLFVSFLFTVPK